jgi:hypothetical protein
MAETYRRTIIKRSMKTLEEDSFHQQTGLKFKEETSKVLYLEHSFVWC